MQTSMKKPIRKEPKEISELSTTSAKIRWMYANGWEKGDIARTLGKRYQHVRNVLLVPVTTPKQ